MTYQFELSCLCGADVDHVNSHADATHGVLVAKCRGCNRQWTVTLFMRPLPLQRSADRREYRARQRVTA